MFLRIPFNLPGLGLDAFNPLAIPGWNLTFLFGRETIPRWNRIVERSPNNVHHRMILARLLHLEKRNDEAIEQFQRGLDLLASAEIARNYDYADNLKAHIHYALGRVFLDLGRRQEARAEWEKVLPLDAGFARLARGCLMAYPAAGTQTKAQYYFIVVRTPEDIATEPFEDEATLWSVYRDLKRAVHRQRIAGVALVCLYPDPDMGTGFCRELTKNPKERAVIQEVIDRRIKEIMV